MKSETPARRLTSRIPTSERTWVLLFGLGVMLLTSLPYVLGYAVQGAQWRFTGFVFGVEDGNSYLAKMLSGSAGAWLFRTPYTASPQTGVAAFLPYLLLGKLASPPGFHEQLGALYHLFRFVAGILAIFATYDFLSFFVRDARARRLGLALATIGGGLGWVLVLLGSSRWLGSLPLEFYSPETFGFLSLYGIPHLALARAALLWGLLAYLRGVELIRRPPGSPETWPQGKALFWQGLKTGVFWLATALAQPITALVFGWVIGLHLAVLGIFQLGRLPGRVEFSADHPDGWNGTRSGWRVWAQQARLALVAALLPAPLLIYTALVFQSDPFLRAWTGQNLILSPHPVHYLLAYGLVLPFAVSGALRLLRSRPETGWLLVAWAASLPLLAYAPVNIQRRLPEGGWVVLACLALYAVEAGRSQKGGEPLPALIRFSPARRAWLLFLAFPSTLMLLSGGLLTAARPALPAFRPAAEVRAYQGLVQQVAQGGVVLAAYETGNALPAWAPLRVVIGHGPESANLASLHSSVAAFFSADSSDPERLALLQTLDVQVVFWGPVERALGSWDPNQADYLEKIYQAEGYQVFRVLAEGMAAQPSLSEPEDP